MSQLKSPKQQSAQQLAEALNTFLNLQSQSQIENVCKSALFLLNNIPACKLACMEYIATFYELASLVNINFLVSQKSSAVSRTDMDNINAMIDSIDAGLAQLLAETANKDIWSVELSKWLIDTLLNILLKHTVQILPLIGNIQPVTNLEDLNVPLVDSLQIWSVQCKSTQSILQLIQRCYLTRLEARQQSADVNNDEDENVIFDMILTASNRTNLFDWVICELGSLDIEQMLRRALASGIREHNLLSPDKQTNLASSMPKRTQSLNFYALNHSFIFKRVLKSYHQELKEANKVDSIRSYLIYLFKLASQCPALLNMLLNDVLNENYDLVDLIWPFLIDSDQLLISLLVECVKQLNNSVAVYDLLSSLLGWLNHAKHLRNLDEFLRLQPIVKQSVENLIDSVYSSYSDRQQQQQQQQSADSIPLLKNLNSINSSTLRLLLDQIVGYLINDDELTNQMISKNRSILHNLLRLIGINGNNYCANTIMSDLMLNVNDRNELNQEFLIKFRQEISLFYTHCFRETIQSILKSIGADYSSIAFRCFMRNILLFFDWDLENPYFMGESISNILIDRVCFVNLIDKLRCHHHQDDFNYSLQIINLYNRLLLKFDGVELKLDVEDALKCGIKLINHFYELCFQLNEANMSQVLNEIQSVNNLLRQTCQHLSSSYNESTPYRNVLLRALIDRLFDSLKHSNHPINKCYENGDDEEIDENANLFADNFNQINAEMMLSKAKLKAVRQSLNVKPNKRVAIDKCLNKTIVNYLVLDILETICTRSSSSSSSTTSTVNSRLDQIKAEAMEVDNSNESPASPPSTTTSASAQSNLIKSMESHNQELRKHQLLRDQLLNLAELLMQHILLENHFVDYNWPSSSLGDTDDFNESELDAIKLFIERDVSVQNQIENLNNRHIIWQLLDFLALDETSFVACAPLIRSLLASQIIQWESAQEQAARNLAKSFEITLKLLNLLNRVENLMPEPLCYIVDIVPLLSTYEVHIVLLTIWRYLKMRLTQQTSNNKPSTKQQPIETRQLRFIFQKNINKLAPFYAKFFNVNKKTIES